MLLPAMPGPLTFPLLLNAYGGVQSAANPALGQTAKCGLEFAGSVQRQFTRTFPTSSALVLHS